MRRAAAFALLFALSGCNRAYLHRVRWAENALKGGDPAQALKFYGEACELERGSDACTKQKEVAAAARAAQLPKARAACVAQDWVGCLTLLDDVRRFAPTAEATSLAEQAMSGHEAVCRGSAGDGLLGYLTFTRCVGRVSPVAHAERWAQLDRTARSQAAQAFLAAAGQAGEARGTSWAYTTLARCLTKSAVPDDTLTSAWGHFVRQRAEGLLVTYNGGASADLCGRVANEFGDRLSCTRSPPTLSVNVSGQPLAVEHTFVDHPRAVEYLERVDRYENPEWRRLARTVERRRETVVEWERQLAVLRSDCEQSGSKQACNRHNALITSYNAEVRELKRLARALDDTPQLLERKVYATFRYTERQHRYRYPVHLTAQLPWRTLTLTPAPAWTSVEQPGFPPAGLEQRYPTPPSSDEVGVEWSQALAAALTEAFREEFAQLPGRVEPTLPAGVEPSPQLEDWLWAQHLAGQNAAKAFGQRVDGALRGRAGYQPPIPCEP